MFQQAQRHPAGPFDENAMLAEKRRFEMQKQMELQEMMRAAQQKVEEQARQVEMREMEFKKQQVIILFL